MGSSCLAGRPSVREKNRCLLPNAEDSWLLDDDPAQHVLVPVGEDVADDQIPPWLGEGWRSHGPSTPGRAEKDTTARIIYAADGCTSDYDVVRRLARRVYSHL